MALLVEKCSFVKTGGKSLEMEVRTFVRIDTECNLGPFAGFNSHKNYLSLLCCPCCSL